jgi:beta-glucosidase
MEAVATINEPWCVAWLSHFIGAHAPGLRDIRAATRAMHHVLLAHARSIEVMRAANQKNLGIVLNFDHPQASTDNPEEIAAARTFDGIHNRWFVEALLRGRYPEDILTALEPHMPDDYVTDLSAISAPIDWLGVNYYTRTIVEHDPNMAWPHYREVPGPLEKTDMGWEIYPDGLHRLLVRLRDDYVGELPIYVTENGMAGDEQVAEGRVDDPVRVRYFEDHIAAVRRAISEGVPVKGYFAWSLLDNYEWSFGYDKRFGIVHVDYRTQARRPKSSYDAFKTAISNR